MAEQATAVVAPAATGRAHRVDRWFYISMALLMILFSAVAFGPSLIEPSTRNVPLPLTPACDNSRHRVRCVVGPVSHAGDARCDRTHRRSSPCGDRWCGAHRDVVIVGYFTLIEEARRGFDLSGDIVRRPPGPGVSNPALMALLWNFLTFGILAAAGLWYRHRPAVHKRLMLLAMLGGLTNTPLGHVVGHWPSLQPWAAIIFPVSTALFLSLSAIYDRVSHGRIHPVSLWGAISIFASGKCVFCRDSAKCDVARVCSVADRVAGRRFGRPPSLAVLRRRRATLRLVRTVVVIAHVPVVKAQIAGR
jgi:hypothetical protein